MGLDLRLTNSALNELEPFCSATTEDRIEDMAPIAGKGDGFMTGNTR